MMDLNVSVPGEDTVPVITTRDSKQETTSAASAKSGTTVSLTLGLRCTLPKDLALEYVSSSQQGKALMLAKLLEAFNDDRPDVSFFFSPGTIIDHE